MTYAEMAIRKAALEQLQKGLKAIYKRDIKDNRIFTYHRLSGDYIPLDFFRDVDTTFKQLLDDIYIQIDTCACILDAVDEITGAQNNRKISKD